MAHTIGKEKPAIDVIVQDVSSQDAPNNSTSAVDPEAQAGVQQVQGIATVWTQASRACTYILIWIVYAVMLLQQAVSGSLMPYVASAFQEHSLLPTISVLSSIFGGVCCLPIAKILDVLGRPSGYALSLTITVLGLVMMATSDNVKTYAAAQVFWTVGNNMALYTVNIFIADTTKMHNRVLVTWLAASPNLFVPWAGGPLSEAFLKGPGWEWYYGSFSIIVLFTCSPLFVSMWLNQRKAAKEGITANKTSDRTFSQGVRYYLIEIDAVGLVLLIAGLAMLLLPFNLYTLQPLGWKSPMIICLLVFGIIVLVLFALWERSFAPVPFLPASLLGNRNVVGSSVLGAVLFVSYYCWFSFFTSFLQVVYDLSISEAGYVAQIYGVGGCVGGIGVGFLIHRTGYFRAITLYGCLPVYTLFMGLLIHFRDASTGIGYVVMSMVFISFSSGAIMAIAPLPAMAAVQHQHVAAVVAVISMFSSIGGAVGSTVASAIWQNVFPGKLMEYLPAEEQPNLMSIFGMLDAQLSYPLGSPARLAIQHAYSDAQQILTIAGTAVWVVAFGAVAIWRNIDTRKVEQVRGNVI